MSKLYKDLECTYVSVCMYLSTFSYNRDVQTFRTKLQLFCNDIYGIDFLCYKFQDSNIFCFCTIPSWKHVKMWYFPPSNKNKLYGIIAYSLSSNLHILNSNTYYSPRRKINPNDLVLSVVFVNISSHLNMEDKTKYVKSNAK